MLTKSIRYIPAVGRFLIVCTFIEDALRIITQWSDQLLYLHDYRHSMAPNSDLQATMYFWFPARLTRTQYRGV